MTWRRLPVALIAAYLAGLALEIVLGSRDLFRVGWGSSYAPVWAIGIVFGFVLGGVWGAVLAPLVLLMQPEAWNRFVQSKAAMIASGQPDIAPLTALALVLQPFPDAWIAGMGGALTRGGAAWLARRRRGARV